MIGNFFPRSLVLCIHIDSVPPLYMQRLLVTTGLTLVFYVGGGGGGGGGGGSGGGGG